MLCVIYRLLCAGYWWLSAIMLHQVCPFLLGHWRGSCHQGHIGAEGYVTTLTPHNLIPPQEGNESLTARYATLFQYSHCCLILAAIAQSGPFTIPEYLLPVALWWWSWFIHACYSVLPEPIIALLRANSMCIWVGITSLPPVWVWLLRFSVALYLPPLWLAWCCQLASQLASVTVASSVLVAPCYLHRHHW